MNASYCDNLAEVLCVNQVRIDFTDKPITAWGGMGVLMGKFLEKIQFLNLNISIPNGSVHCST